VEGEGARDADRGAVASPTLEALLVRAEETERGTKSGGADGRPASRGLATAAGMVRRRQIRKLPREVVDRSPRGEVVERRLRSSGADRELARAADADRREIRGGGPTASS
jgi:hypothetical protein